MALAALAHRLAETLFGAYGPGNDIVRVSTCVCGDGTLAQAASAAAAVCRQAQSLWGDRLSAKPDAMSARLLARLQDMVLELLAHCTARSLDAIGGPPQRRAKMAVWWQPPTRHYLLPVGKTAMLHAVCEATGAEPPPALAAHGAGLLEGTRWLPVPLRAKCPDDAAEAEAERARAQASRGEQSPAPDEDRVTGRNDGEDAAQRNVDGED